MHENLQTITQDTRLFLHKNLQTITQDTRLFLHKNLQTITQDTRLFVHKNLQTITQDTRLFLHKNLQTTTHIPVHCICCAPVTATLKSGVFCTTALWSVFAYVWILVVLEYNSPNIVSVVSYFPAYLYLADVHTTY